MTTLHLTRADLTGLQAGADGSVTITLTEQGARRLVKEGARHAMVLRSREDQRAAYLRSLTNVELVELATSRFGGPEADVAAEGARRMGEVLERLRPALATLRTIGVLEPEPGHG